MIRGEHDRRGSQSGAIAVFVAIVALLLFSIAALTVDLGNGWSRKRAVQKQADVSAIAAGWGLPMTTANKSEILNNVAAYLDDAANRTTGQQSDPIIGAQLSNGDVSDGEVSFMDDNGNPCNGTSTTIYCTQMKVVAPSAEVDFGFANAMTGGGFSHVDVQQSAVVRLFTQLPRANETLPFWLPNGCGYGASEADTSNGANNSPSPTPTPSPAPTTPFVPGNGETDNKLSIQGSGITIDQGATSNPITGWSIAGLGDGQNANATYRFFSPTGSTTPIEKNANVSNFTVGPEITNTPGEWWVYGYGDSSKSTKGNPGGNPKYTPNHLVVTVAPLVTPPVPVDPDDSLTGCQGPDRGNFGQLDSPRKDGTHGQQALAENIAFGLDHTLIPFDWGGVAPVSNCGTTQHGFIDGASPDTAPVDDRNCVVADSGNDGPYVFDGLVSGTNGKPGRLNAPTTCPSPVALDSSKFDGINLNNDALGCFLRDGATLFDIAQTAGVNTDMLDPAVVKSPRFVWLPVVVSNDRTVKNFQPILTFVPGFITDATIASPTPSSTNGLDVNGNSVKVLHVFVFNSDALPVDERSPVVDYDPGLHLPSKVILTQ